MICDICNRELPDNLDECNRHHLIPKSKGGVETILIHKICHNKIHSIWTETELGNYWHTVDRILEHPDMIKFISWVNNKPLDFYTTTKDTTTRKNRRKR